MLMETVLAETVNFHIIFLGISWGYKAKSILIKSEWIIALNFGVNENI